MPSCQRVAPEKLVSNDVNHLVAGCYLVQTFDVYPITMTADADGSE